MKFHCHWIASWSMFTFRGWIPRFNGNVEGACDKTIRRLKSRLQFMMLTIQSLQCTDFNSTHLYGLMQSLKYYVECFQMCWNPQKKRRAAQDISVLIQHLSPAPYVKLLLKQSPTSLLNLHREWVCYELELKSPTWSKGSSVGMLADRRVTEGLLQCLLLD